MRVRFSSIQVTPGLRRRLARYKGPGMSYESVIEVFMAAISPGEFRARHVRASASLGSGLKRSLARDVSSAAEEARRFEAERVAGLTPAARMEEAYRLRELLRGPT